jgi:hypothetical protein
MLDLSRQWQTVLQWLCSTGREYQDGAGDADELQEGRRKRGECLSRGADGAPLRGDLHVRLVRPPEDEDQEG